VSLLDGFGGSLAKVLLLVTLVLGPVIVGRPPVLGRLARRLGLRRIFCALNGIRHLSDRRVLFQKDTMTCGLACVEMILRESGLVSQKDVSSKTRIGPGGFSMLDLADLLESNGLTNRGMRFAGLLDLKAWLESGSDLRAILLLESERLLPTSLLLRPGRLLLSFLGVPLAPYRHWVILDEINERSVSLLDPSLGHVEMSGRQFQRIWDGFALLAQVSLRPAENTS